MLASPCEDLGAIRYPVLATPKIDGIRCVIRNGRALSRSLKPIANRFVAATLAGLPPFDGEIVVPGTFQDVTSGIMSTEGSPDFRYKIFDMVPPEGTDIPYCQRMENLRQTASLLGPGPIADRRLDFLFPIEISSRAQLDLYLQQCLAAGHEGVMVRDPFGGYKYGRATLKQGWLTKVKPFEDAEAMIIGFEEQMKNGNEATTDNLGHTERSSHKANLVPKGTLGALVVESEKFGQFNIGTGFDDAFRAEVWANRDAYLGKLVTFRYQAIGTKDKPRIPSFKGIRNPSDL